MFCFRSVRALRRWAVVSLAAVAFALVDFDGSIWSFEVFPDGHVPASSFTLDVNLLVRLAPMYTFTFLVSQGTGAYFETVSRLASLADVKRNVFFTLRSCRKELLSAVVIVRDPQGGGEYWI